MHCQLWSMAHREGMRSISRRNRPRRCYLGGALTSTLLIICPAWSATRANLVRVGLALEGARLAVGNRGASPASRGAVVAPIGPAIHDARAGRCQVILSITRKRRLGVGILAVASRDRAVVGIIWLGALHACNVATQHTPDTFERTDGEDGDGRTTPHAENAAVLCSSGGGGGGGAPHHRKGCRSSLACRHSLLPRPHSSRSHRVCKRTRCTGHGCHTCRRCIREDKHMWQCCLDPSPSKCRRAGI